MTHEEQTLTHEDRTVIDHATALHLTDGTLVTIESAPFDDPAGTALRAAMEGEMVLRYWDRSTTAGGGPLPAALGVDASEAVWTGVARDEAGLPVGHAMLRWYASEPHTVELKRMYIAPSHRGRGLSAALLRAVDAAAERLGAHRIVLHTGDRQADAVRVYEKHGYTTIDLLDLYTEMPYSVCMAKPTPSR